MTREKIIIKTEKLDCEGCKACASSLEADNLKHALARLSGISKVKVDEITGKVTAEYDPQKIGSAKIVERIQKLGYHAEVSSTEKIE